jgi:uncharacterized protein YbaR (Trm112 family)
MDKKLLSILCCPVTRRQLLPAKTDLLERVNTAIETGAVSNRDGTVLGDALTEALVTDDGKLLYPVADGIPVLLEGESISAEQFAGG